MPLMREHLEDWAHQQKGRTAWGPEMANLCHPDEKCYRVRYERGVLSLLCGTCHRMVAQITVASMNGDLSASMKPPTVDRIMHEVSRFYDVSVQELVGSCRRMRFVRARHVAMWLIRRHTDRSFQEIAMQFCNRHHTTVMNACGRVDERLDDSDFAREVKVIETTLAVRAAEGVMDG